MSFVRTSFLYGRDFMGDADFADHCACWLAEVAKVRIHGTTSERPDKRSPRDEQATLQSLAPRSYPSLVFMPP